MPYGGEGEGLHLSPVREALNCALLYLKYPAKDVLVRGFIFDVDTGLLPEVQPIAQRTAS